MPNNNCLAGMQCPKCQNEEPFKIEVRALITLYDDGSDPDEGLGDIDWQDDTYCECGQCAHYGTIKDFRVKETPNA